jgi:hypothetical protein
MPSIIVSKQQLAEIDGRTLPAAQIRWLERQKWSYAIGG